MAIFTWLSISIVPSIAYAVPRGGRIQPATAVGLLAASEPGWRFDLLSAAIGFVLGLLVALGIYLVRHRIVAARDTMQSKVAHVQERITTGVEDRYREQVIEMAESSHLLKRHTVLSDLYVPGRFVVPHALPPALQPPENEQESERWHEMRLHSSLHPLLVTVDLREAVKQHSKLAFLGEMGCGRTTLLAYVAQLYARKNGWRLRYSEPQEEDSPELVAARDRERERLPVQIALQAIDLAPTEEGGRHVLIDPITEYLSSSLHGLIAMPSASMVRAKIINGNCVLLFDNLDMLDRKARRQVLDWIGQLTRAYPDNVFILAGGIEGYAALQEIEFATLMLDGFDQRQVSRFVQRWEGMREELEVRRYEDEMAAARAAFDEALARAREDGRPPPTEEEFLQAVLPEPMPHLLDVWPAGRRERVMPLDLALTALLWREQNAVPDAQQMRYAQIVVATLNRAADSLLKPPQWAPILSSVAWDMQREERYETNREVFEQLITNLLDESYVASADLRRRAEDEEDEKPDFGQQAHDAFEALLRAGDLLVDVGRERIAFVHPTWRAYFAAQHAARSNESEMLIAHVRNPQWRDTVLFYSALSNPAPLVTARLEGTDDVFRTDFFAAASYLAVSTRADERLHGGVLAELAQVFLDPAQPTILCCRAASTIAKSKQKGSLYLFGQAMQHEDAHVRRLGVWGLAQVDDERAIGGLQHAFSKGDRLVRIEALYALCAIGGDATIDGLIQGLQNEDELTRRVAAELLAAMGGEGHDLLKQAAGSDDMYIRRAAVFGLGVVGESWARDLLDNMRREDGEWFVRSAATEALERVVGDAPPIVLASLQVQDHQWLEKWALGRELPVGSEEDALRVLYQAVQEGDQTIKLATADLLRIYGEQRAIPALKAVLKDEDVLVREAAFVALHEISQRTGSRITA